jgi:O-antigen/teichoic acid export membrane protein
VTGAPAGRRRPWTPREELAEGTPHGDVYLDLLIRSQLRLSLLGLGAFGGLVGSLPLLFLLFPSLMDLEPLGVPLPVLILVAPLFPLIVVIGWLYQRRADALDEAFRDVVSRE